MKLPSNMFWYRALAVLLLLLAWKLLSWHLQNNLILPSPENVMEDFVALLFTHHFYHAFGFTLLRGFAGFVMAFILAVILGIPAGLHKGFNAFLGPFVVITRSTPVIAFILLALIWLGPGKVPVFIALLTMFPLLCTGIITGIQQTDAELVGMAKVYRIGTVRMIRELYLPSLMPVLLNSIANAIGFGWRAVIIGEVLSQPQWGMGTEMQVAQTYLLVSNVICWTVVAVITGYLFGGMMRTLTRHAIKWKGDDPA